MAAYASSMASP